MRELALFAGAGGGILGGKLLGWQTVGYVEWEAHCQEVLRQRIADGLLDAAPIFVDVRGFVSEGYADAYGRAGVVDVVSGGFPCQPFSLAGKRAGADDERNMWPATVAVLRAVRPRLAFLENVPGLLVSGYFGTVLGDLAALGFDAEWCVLGADDLGFPHRRKRLWILAYRDERGREAERVGALLDRDRAALGNDADGCGGARDDVADPGPMERHDGEPQRRGSAEARARLHAGRGGQTPVADPSGEPAQLRREPRELRGAAENAEGQGHQRERGRAPARAGGADLADPSRDGRLEGRAEPAGKLGGSDAAERGIGVGLVHADSEHRAQRRGAKPRTKEDRRIGRAGPTPPGPHDLHAWRGVPPELEPALCRMAHGMAGRVVRLRALGNGQVPAVAAAAFLTLAARIGLEVNA